MAGVGDWLWLKLFIGDTWIAPTDYCFPKKADFPGETWWELLLKAFSIFGFWRGVGLSNSPNCCGWGWTSFNSPGTGIIFDELETATGVRWLALLFTSAVEETPGYLLFMSLKFKPSILIFFFKPPEEFDDWRAAAAAPSKAKWSFLDLIVVSMKLKSLSLTSGYGEGSWISLQPSTCN